MSGKLYWCKLRGTSVILFSWNTPRTHDSTKKRNVLTEKPRDFECTLKPDMEVTTFCNGLRFGAGRVTGGHFHKGQSCSSSTQQLPLDSSSCCCAARDRCDSEPCSPFVRSDERAAQFLSELCNTRVTPARYTVLLFDRYVPSQPQLRYIS